MNEVEIAIGIDLGTTNSLVAVVDADGRVKILPNEDGNFLTPSCVCFTNEEPRQILVGTTAFRRMGSEPKNTIIDAKRFIGVENSRGQALAIKYGFVVRRAKLKNVPIFHLDTGIKIVSQRPQDIAAKVLESLRKTAETALKDRADKIVRISKAVIAVPAYFSMAQKQATLEAAELAGIPYTQLVSEPAAAAYAYGHEKKRLGSYKLLVFDFGGGTFDVTILDVEDQKFVQRAIDGDMQLGGRDIDLALQKFIYAEIWDRCRKNPFVDPELTQKLLDECEKLKRLLTSSEFESFDVGEVFPDVNLEIVVTRGMFESICKPTLMRAITIVKRILFDAKLTANEIDEVLLVGGSSRIPLVESLLISEVKFSAKQLNKSLNADEAVALGAALLAAQLPDKNAKENQPFKLKLVEAIPLSVGILVFGDLFDVKFPRHTTIPSKTSWSYCTTQNDQNEMGIEIYEGERKMAKENNFLGRLEIGNLPRGMAGRVCVVVTLEIDRNGLLQASATCGQRTVSMPTDYAPRRSNDRTISEALADAELHAEFDEDEAKRIEAKNGLELAIECSRYKFVERSAAICDVFGDWLKTHQNEDTECYNEKHKKLKRRLASAYESLQRLCLSQTTNAEVKMEMKNEDTTFGFDECITWDEKRKPIVTRRSRRLSKKR